MLFLKQKASSIKNTQGFIKLNRICDMREKHKTSCISKPYNLNIMQKKHWWLLIVIAHFTLRFIYLYGYELTFDEKFSVEWSLLSWQELFTSLYYENNPPLHFILLKLWGSLFGSSTLSVRLPSILLSCVALLYVYKISQKVFPALPPFVICLLFSFSRFNLLYSTTARSYELLLCLSILSFYYYLLLLELQKKNTYVLFTIICTLMLYTHFTAILWLSIFFIHYSLVHIKNKKLMVQWIICFCIILISYLPYLHIFIYRLSSTVHTGTWVPPLTYFGQVIDVFWWIFGGKIKLALILLYSLIYIFLLTFNFNKLSQNVKTIFFFIITFQALSIICSLTVSPIYIGKYHYISSFLYLLIQVLCLEKISKHFHTKTIQGFILSFYMIVYTLSTLYDTLSLG